MKVPYEQVSIQADIILMRMLEPGVDQSAIYEDYLAFLRACGWSLQEFDNETLRRTDAGWEDPPLTATKMMPN